MLVVVVDNKPGILAVSGIQLVAFRRMSLLSRNSSSVKKVVIAGSYSPGGHAQQSVDMAGKKEMCTA